MREKSGKREQIRKLRIADENFREVWGKCEKNLRKNLYYCEVSFEESFWGNWRQLKYQEILAKFPRIFWRQKT